MRNYFSSYHLWAARKFAQEAGAIEAIHEGQSKFDVGHRAYVNSSILASVAFLEAAINEVYKDAFDEHSSYLSSLDAGSISSLAHTWEDWHHPGRRYIPVLQKYEQALDCCGTQGFEKGTSPYQDAALVVKLRNVLVHSAPEDLTRDDPHELGDALKGRFSENRLMHGSGNPFFPDKCLGEGCATWAVDAAIGVADIFFQRIGVIPNYQRVTFLL